MFLCLYLCPFSLSLFLSVFLILCLSLSLLSTLYSSTAMLTRPRRPCLSLSLSLWLSLCLSPIYLIFALEGLEGVDILQGRRITHPLDGLPCRHDPDVLHGHDGIEEQLEALLVVRCGEPKTEINT